MWAGRRGRAQALLQANLALDAVSRDVQRVCTMRKERSAAREELAREEYVRLFSMAAIDERCGVRHAASVIGSLRAWARTVEAHERACTGRTPIVVSHTMYHTALL